MDEATDRLARPPVKRAMQTIRRMHLYFGLLLFPWAVLYGVTAFLFNHPSAFADAPTSTFGPDALVGTPFEHRPGARDLAEASIAKLNEKQKPATPYSLAGEAKFVREFAFATVKAEEWTVSVLIDVKTGSGTVRSQPTRERVEPEKAPFATAQSVAAGERAGRGPRADGAPRGSGGSLKLDAPFAESIRASIPAILERTGFPPGDATVTSVPDVQFPILAGGRVWTATFNPMTGVISGTATDAKPVNELGWRRFLLRLHTAHGYPGETNAKWYWAVVVDVMAFVMCFWGLSGLAMWWQLKAQRKLGFALLALSTIAASALGIAMHAALSG
jgi:hypothetical protein